MLNGKNFLGWSLSKYMDFHRRRRRTRNGRKPQGFRHPTHRAEWQGDSRHGPRSKQLHGSYTPQVTKAEALGGYLGFKAEPTMSSGQQYKLLTTGDSDGMVGPEPVGAPLSSEGWEKSRAGMLGPLMRLLGHGICMAVPLLNLGGTYLRFWQSFVGAQSPEVESTPYLMNKATLGTEAGSQWCIHTCGARP